MERIRIARRYDIDILKCIGMFLVSWAHFIDTGTYALEIPHVIKDAMPTPILHNCNLVKIDNFFYFRFHIQAGVIACVLFFFISGYFIPKMQEKYNSGDFPKLWFKQGWRIIPTLAFCVLLNGILAYKAQDITFGIKDYIVTCLYGGGVYY